MQKDTTVLNVFFIALCIAAIIAIAVYCRTVYCIKASIHTCDGLLRLLIFLPVRVKSNNFYENLSAPFTELTSGLLIVTNKDGRFID